MGSDSDLGVMKEAAALLDEFKVPYEITVVSAHRTTKRMFNYARTARQRGLEVIERAASDAPGTVCSADAQGVVVACGADALRVTELQRAGGKRLPAQAFLSGMRLTRGTRLGAGGG